MAAQTGPSELNDKQARFVDEYLIDLNATQAAIRSGYSAKTAKEQGARLYANANVRAAIDAAIEARSEKTEITAEKVFQRFWAIASADPRELVQYRHGACPHCWGSEPTAEDLEAQAHGGALRRQKAQHGDHTRDPDPACEGCGGEGIGRVVVADTRHLKGAAKLLYAGVKVSKGGLEVKMHNQMDALLKVGQHLGMFKESVDVNATVRFIIEGAPQPKSTT